MAAIGPEYAQQKERHTREIAHMSRSAPALLQHHRTLNSDNLKDTLLADFYIHHPNSIPKV
jgi:hypothetical protein